VKRELGTACRIGEKGGEHESLKGVLGKGGRHFGRERGTYSRLVRHDVNLLGVPFLQEGATNKRKRSSSQKGKTTKRGSRVLKKESCTNKIRKNQVLYLTRTIISLTVSPKNDWERGISTEKKSKL